jgi:hypothetical protein
MSSVAKKELSNISYIDGLLYAPNYIWSNTNNTSTTITFSFPTLHNAIWDSQYLSSPSEVDNWTPLSDAEQGLVRLALDYWARVANIEFIEVEDSLNIYGDFRFAHSELVESTSQTYAWTTPPELIGTTTNPLSGDVWLDNSDYSFYSSSFNLGTIVHEIGHALGLSHPQAGAARLSTLHDNTQFTIMSNKFYDFQRQYTNPITPKIFDIAAVQYLYGENQSFNANNNYYNVELIQARLHLAWEDGFYGVDKSFSSDMISQFYSPDDSYTLWDANGTDHIDFSSLALSNNTETVLSLTPGSFSSFGLSVGSFSLAYNTWIENLTATISDDIIYDNVASNTIYALSGNDTIYLSDGTDTIDGGADFDKVFINDEKYNFSINLTPNNTLTLSHINNNYQISLNNIEQLNFNDLSIDLNTDGNSAQLFRLYQAVFDRLPDADGLGFWINAMHLGLSLYDVAAQFSSSNEFTQRYGKNTSNQDYINLLYLNVLDRNADADGSRFWLQHLDNGTINQEQLLVAFSESNENILYTAPTIEAGGITYTPYETTLIS